MADGVDRAELEAAGERIERLLSELSSLGGPRVLKCAEALVAVVTDLYGEGLARVVAIACEAGAPRGPDLLEHLARDELVGSLLMLHGLHPASLRRRVEDALAGLSPLLGIEDARVVDADEQEGRVRVRLILAKGRGQHRETLERIVREAVDKAAPDVLALEIDCPDTGAPVAFKPRRGGDPAAVATRP